MEKTCISLYFDDKQWHWSLDKMEDIISLGQYMGTEFTTIVEGTTLTKDGSIKELLNAVCKLADENDEI